MKQLKPFTKISLSLLGLGAILSLIGYLAGGWRLDKYETCCRKLFSAPNSQF